MVLRGNQGGFSYLWVDQVATVVGKFVGVVWKEVLERWNARAGAGVYVE